MRPEIKFNQSYGILFHSYTQLIPKNPWSSEEKSRKVLKTSDVGGKDPGLAQLAKSIWKYQKSDATYGTSQCDVGLIIYSENAIHSNTIKQHPDIAAIWPHCLSGTIMLQITVKYFDFQISRPSLL